MKQTGLNAVVKKQLVTIKLASDNIKIGFPTSYDKIIERLNNINPLQYGKTGNFINGDIINLSKDIDGIAIYNGKITHIVKLFKDSYSFNNNFIVSKEHPAFNYYVGIKYNIVWMFSGVTGYYNSFFLYWKKCEKHLG